jgi:hypothetical protein
LAHDRTRDRHAIATGSVVRLPGVLYAASVDGNPSNGRAD